MKSPKCGGAPGFRAKTVEAQTKIVRHSARHAAQNRAEPMGGENNMASNSNGTSRINVPQAKGALNQMKYEIASELGINLKQGYNGDLPSRQAGYIGGYMTKRLVEQAERSMSGKA